MAIESLAIKITAVNAAGSILSSLGNKLKGIKDVSGDIKKNFQGAIKSAQGAATAAILTKEIGKGFLTAAGAAGSLQTSIKGLKKELISPEKSLKQVNKELKSIEDAAFSIQAKTPFDQKAVINQATILKKAGLEVNAIASGALEATSLLAAVESVDPETAASIVAVADAAFDLKSEAGGFTDFADLMSRATSLANFGVEDFGESLKYAGATAKELKLSTRETAVSIAALATAGLKGSQGGTTLAAIFRDIKKQRPDLVFDKATGATRELSDIIADLNKELDGLNDEQRNSKLSKIFQEEGRKGIGALLENYEKLNPQIEKQASLQEKVDTILEGYEAKISSLSGTSGSVIARLFTPALDPLSKLVDKTNEFVTAIGEATKGDNNLGKVVSGTSAGALATGGALTAGLGLLSVLKFKKVLKGTGGLKGLLKGAGGTAAGVAKGSLISKITGGAVQEVYVVNPDEIGGGIASALPAALPAAGGAGAGAAGGFFANFATKLKAIFPTFIRWGVKLKAGLIALGGTIAKFASVTLLPALKTAILSIGSALAGSALAVGGAIGAVIGGALGMIFQEEILGFLEKFPALDGFLDDLLPKFGAAADHEEKMAKLKEQERAADLRFRSAIAGKVKEARASGNEAEVSRLSELFRAKIGAQQVTNEISIAVDQNGRSLVDGGKSQTNVSSEIKPKLD